MATPKRGWESTKPSWYSGMGKVNRVPMSPIKKAIKGKIRRAKK